MSSKGRHRRTREDESDEQLRAWFARQAAVVEPCTIRWTSGNGTWHQCIGPCLPGVMNVPHRCGCGDTFG
jgi:hypothetical protein